MYIIVNNDLQRKKKIGEKKFLGEVTCVNNRLYNGGYALFFLCLYD